LIDLEADVREVDFDQHHTGGLGTQLMNLAAKSGANQDYIDKQLKNLYNIQIFATMYFGEQKQGMDLIFDSGSSWVWVEGYQCDTCANPNKF
jgi:hypothetical protein